MDCGVKDQIAAELHFCTFHHRLGDGDGSISLLRFSPLFLRRPNGVMKKLGLQPKHSTSEESTEDGQRENERGLKADSGQSKV